MGALGDLTKLGLGGHDLLDQRLLEQQRARLLAAAAQGIGLTDREKIELCVIVLSVGRLALCFYCTVWFHLQGYRAC